MIEMNTYHLEIIKSDFLINTGERGISLCDLPLSYKSLKYAHKAFNADTVITYPLIGPSAEVTGLKNSASAFISA